VLLIDYGRNRYNSVSLSDPEPSNICLNFHQNRLFSIIFYHESVSNLAIQESCMVYFFRNRIIRELILTQVVPRSKKIKENQYNINNYKMCRNTMMDSAVDGDIDIDELLDGAWCGFEPAKDDDNDDSDTGAAVMDISTGPDGPMAESSPIRIKKVNAIVPVHTQSITPAQPYMGSNLGNVSAHNISRTTTEGGHETNPIGPTYIQCRNSRTASLAVPMYSTAVGVALGTAAVIQEGRVGSLDVAEDTEVKKTFRGTRISAGGTLVNQNMSSTFDPHTLICTVCNTPHSIIPGDGVGFVLVMSDQSFATTLSGTENCVPIVRLEDATLDELFNLCKEILDRQQIPPGSLFLVGSTSYLAKVGTTIYAQEWISLVKKYSERWRISQVGPLPPVLRENSAGSTTKVVTELKVWFDSVYGTNIEYLKNAWNVVINNLACQPPDVDLCSQEIYTVPLPESITNYHLRPVKFVVNSSAAVTALFDGGATFELLRALLNTLTTTFNCRAHPGDILERELAEPECTKEPLDCEPVLLVIGGSHSKILATELFNKGKLVVDLSIPGWTPTDNNIKNLEGKLEKIENLEKYIVVADFVSNYVFRFEQMDGQLAFPYKVGGRYHMLSKVTVCNKESLGVALDKLRDVLGMLKGPKICLPPLPRYLHRGCCDEEGHCEGVDDPLHAASLLEKCQSVRKSMKEYFVGNHTGIWVPDTTQKLFPECTNSISLANALKHVYARDSVHLTKEGYTKLAEIVIECITSRFSASLSVSGASMGPLGEKPEKYFWRGFTSPTGSERPKEKFFSQRNRTAGGGKWRGGNNSGGMGRGGRIPPHAHPFHGRKRF